MIRCQKLDEEKNGSSNVLKQYDVGRQKVGDILVATFQLYTDNLKDECSVKELSQDDDDDEEEDRRKRFMAAIRNKVSTMNKVENSEHFISTRRSNISKYI